MKNIIIYVCVALVSVGLLFTAFSAYAAVDTAKVTMYVTADDGSGSVYGANVTVIGSDGEPSYGVSGNPHGRVDVVIPKADDSFILHVNADGFCPFNRIVNVRDNPKWAWVILERDC